MGRFVRLGAAGLAGLALSACVMAAAAEPSSRSRPVAATGAPPPVTVTAPGLTELSPLQTQQPAPTVTVPRHYQGDRPVRVMFIGDSTAYTTAVGLEPMAGAYHSVIDDEGIMGCGVVTDGPYIYFGQLYPAVLPQCRLWAFAWRNALQRDDPDVSAVMIGRWELMDRYWDGRWTHVGDPAYDQYLMSQFDFAVTLLASRGGKVALFTDPYFLRGHTPSGGLWPEDQPQRVDLMNSLLREVAARHPGVVTVVDFGARLSPGGHFAMNIDGVPIRSDGVHMTPQAGAWLAPWLMPQLEAIGASS
jgi:hypothetical protein